MPSAYDRRNVPSQGDHSPLSGLLDFEEIQDTAKRVGQGPQGVLHNVASIFGLGGVADLLGSITPEAIWSGITNAFIAPLNFFAQLVGGFVSIFQIPLLDASKILNLPQLFQDVTDGFKAIFNGWFGSGAHGTPNEVRQTVEAIKVAVSNGYTLQTVTVNGAFTIPACTELNGIVIGAGDNGAYGGVGAGASQNKSGGVHGHGGPYVFKSIDLSVYPPGTVLTNVVGAGPSGSGAAGGVSQIKDAGGTVLVSSAAGLGGISLPQGLMSTTSSAGDGGDGGDAVTPSSGSATATDGTAGKSTGVANGGTGGNSRVGTGAGSGSGGAGTNGGAGQYSNVPMCGGAGGGGGGGCSTISSLWAAYGGTGGNGGFPGGGGGGSGAAAGGIAPGTNAYGIGANGIIAYLYK